MTYLKRHDQHPCIPAPKFWCRWSVSRRSHFSDTQRSYKVIHPHEALTHVITEVKSNKWKFILSQLSQSKWIPFDFLWNPRWDKPYVAFPFLRCISQASMFSLTCCIITMQYWTGTSIVTMLSLRSESKATQRQWYKWFLWSLAGSSRRKSGEHNMSFQSTSPVVWWMGVDYELFFVTLCTRSHLQKVLYFVRKCELFSKKVN